MSQTNSPAENVSPSIINDDKKSIQEEEREKILNIENEQKSAIVTEERRPKDVKEGMEVKPKKIPIGGIQMPGFFTRSKSKEQCKEDDPAEGTELIEQDQETKEDIAAVPARIKLPNPFKKTKPGEDEEGEKSGESKDRLKLLETIRLPLVSVFQKMKRTSESQNLTNNQNQAELASMETLDDKSNSDLKTVPLDDKKDAEKQEQSSPEGTLLQKLRAYRMAIVCGVLFLIIVIVIVACTSSVPEYKIARIPLVKNGLVNITCGCGFVEGKMEDGAYVFRGIPYARPPIGDLRFKYAQPLNKIDYCWNGTFKANDSTRTCVQLMPNGIVTGVEDCLTLDIVTPSVGYEKILPVVVLIGADSLMGGSPGKMRPSARYARNKSVVFVRPNFRLGPLGFLSLDILSKSDYPLRSGNYGLSDILEALAWIQLNIGDFGGDKNAVTLFGHKAGATLVTALATMPQKEGKEIFARAWASSGGAVYPTKPLNESEAEFRSYLKDIECGDVECLRSKDAESLFKAVQYPWRKPQPDLPSQQEDPSKQQQWLVLDGIFLKESPNEVLARGSLPVNLIIGSTAQAADTELLRLKRTNWTEGFVRQHIKESYLGNLTDEILKKYPATYRGLSTLVTDVRITCPLYNLWKQTNNVTFYVVNQTRFETQTADIDSDIEAILGRYEPKTPEQKRYYPALQQLFYNFVWYGKINPKYLEKNVLIVDQDILLNSTYSECEYLSLKNIVPRFAALD